MEIDDGLSVETMEDGRTRVWVHIADPGRYVRLGSPLDLEARQRASTLYQPTEVIPMFPMPLASGPLSLVAGRDSPAFSLTALLGPSGELEALDITPSTIRVSHRLTYEFADAVLAREDGATGSEDGAQASEERGAEGDGSHGRGPEEEGVSDAVISEQLRELMRLGWLRRRFRESQGAFNFERTEARVRVEAPHSEQPRVEVHTRAQESPSSVLVMEMMVLAGEVAAVFGAHYGIPLPFRGHPPTQPPPGEALEVCKSPKERKELVLGTMARSMMCAGQRVAHSALGLEGYVQITSPIRRYCDLLAQFQIKAVLRGDDPPLSHEEMHRIVESCHEKALAIKVTAHPLASLFGLHQCLSTRESFVEHPP